MDRVLLRASRWNRWGSAPWGFPLAALGFVWLLGCGDTDSRSDSSTATEGMGGSASSVTGQPGSGGGSMGSTDTSSGGAGTMGADSSGGAATTDANSSGGASTANANGSGGGASTTDADSSGGASTTNTSGGATGGSGGAAETNSTGSAGSGGSGGTTSQTDTCEVIDGQTYWSVDELECGLGPEGVVTCNWSIEFLAGVFLWSYSDIGETGSYTCEGDDIIGMAGGREVQGFLDRTSGELTWDGVLYSPAL